MTPLRPSYDTIGGRVGKSYSNLWFIEFSYHIFILIKSEKNYKKEKAIPYVSVDGKI